MNYDIIVLGHFSKDKLVIHGIEINAPGGAVNIVVWLYQ